MAECKHDQDVDWVFTRDVDVFRCNDCKQLLPDPLEIMGKTIQDLEIENKKLRQAMFDLAEGTETGGHATQREQDSVRNALKEQGLKYISEWDLRK